MNQTLIAEYLDYMDSYRLSKPDYSTFGYADSYSEILQAAEDYDFSAVLMLDPWEYVETDSTDTAIHICHLGGERG